jgi:outer membrane protein assembly factor BamE (lipoprotein component of BamABCDE complex)
MRNIAIAALCAVLAGCAGTPFDWSQAKQIRVGMTEAEIVALMGKPYLVKTQGDNQLWVWSYSGLTQTGVLSVPMKDGLVTSVPAIPFS